MIGSAGRCEYSDNIDDVVRTLSEGNNGLYTNEWLIADTRSNEIAMFELGTETSTLRRSSKGEWFGGTEGFYWGCNNAKDLQVRMESVASLNGAPANLVFHSSDRDRAWLAWFDRHKGKIDAAAGKEAFTTAPLAAWPALDAKVTTTDMVGRLEVLGVFGHPMGQVWEPTDSERSLYPETGALVPNDWTTLSFGDVTTGADDSKSVDIEGTSRVVTTGGSRRSLPAWEGTLLPGEGSSAWLASAFAEHEPIVPRGAESEANWEEPTGWAQEFALAVHCISNYLSAVAGRGEDLALSRLAIDLRDDGRYEIAAGKGVLVLQALRDQLGDEKYNAIMSSYGEMYAGKPADVDAFVKLALQIDGGPTQADWDAWLGADAMNTLGAEVQSRWESGRFWTVTRFEHEPDKSLIVYGTLADVDAQRDAAKRLQWAIRRRWSNVEIPVKADTEVTENDLRGHHILLVGRPTTNAWTERLRSALPVTFDVASFRLGDSAFGHPGSGLIVAGPSPFDRSRSVVVFAGNSADATWHLVESLPRVSAEAVLIENRQAARPLVLPMGRPENRTAGAGGGAR